MPILLFHRVSDQDDPYWPPLKVDDFKKIIRFFGKHYEFKSLDDLLTAPADELKNACFIVFDDAYRDFLENVIPLVKERIPVTMFVPVESIDTERPIWTTLINNYISRSKSGEINLVIGEEHLQLSTASNREKLKTAGYLEKKLRELKYSIFRPALDSIISHFTFVKQEELTPVMTWHEIRSTSDFIDYQSHTLSHPTLGNIDSMEVLVKELKESKAALESRLGGGIKYISYPIGSYSLDVLKHARNYYTAGFAVNNRLVELKRLSNEDYKFEIPRFNVSDSDPYELMFRVNGFHKMFGR